jgi:hypothetical protein
MTINPAELVKVCYLVKNLSHLDEYLLTAIDQGSLKNLGISVKRLSSPMWSLPRDSLNGLLKSNLLRISSCLWLSYESLILS